MVGGDLHWIWKPYEIYQNVDYASLPVSHILYEYIDSLMRSILFLYLQIYGILF
jgi:hypothetical protein